MATFGGSFSLGSQEYFDYFCQPCSKGSHHFEAEGYCTDCDEFLCEDCFKIHTKPTALQHHVMLDKHQMKTRAPPYPTHGNDRLDTQIDRCDQHKNKMIEYFCTVHQALVCSACFMLHHRTCDPVQFIPDETATLTDSKDYKDLIHNLDSLDNKTNDAKKTFQGNIMVADDIHARVMHEFDNYRNDVLKGMDECKADLAELAGNIRDADKELMKSGIDKTESTAKEIRIFQSELKQLETSKQLSRLFIAMKKSEGKMQYFQKALGGLKDDIRPAHYTFVPNDQVKTVIRTPDGFGTLRQDSDRKRPSEVVTPAKQMPQPTVKPKRPKPFQDRSTEQIGTKKPLSLISATHVADINIRASKDAFDPLITGIAKVGNKLVVCDNNSSKVRLVSLETNRILDRVDLSDETWDVTNVSTDQIALTVPDAKKLVFFNVTDKLEHVRDMKFKHCCSGVAYQSNKLALTFSNPCKVEVYDLAGKLLHFIAQDRVGNSIFGEPRYVAFGSVRDTLIVSDRGNHSVLCVTYDAQIRAVYKDKELRGPHQPVLDEDGNVYVCGRWSQDVHVINPGLEKGKVILEHDDGITGPRALCLCRETGCLYTGANNGIVKVYTVT